MTTRTPGYVGRTFSVARLATLLASTFAKLAGGQTLTGGFTGTSYNLGTITGANQTITPTLGNSNIQHATLNGSSLTGTLTFDVPSGVGTSIVEITNGGSGAVAASLSTSNYDKVDGTWVSTNGKVFQFISSRSNGKKYLSIVAF